LLGLEWLLPTFLLIFFRITSFFLIAPVFGTRSVPSTFKLGLSFFISLLVFQVIGVESQVAFDEAFLILLIKEIGVGILLGFAASIFLYALQIAGGLIDLQMGFAIANVIDPQTGAQSPIMGNFKYLLAILVLLLSDGHHMLIRGILNSFFLVPLDHWFLVDEGTITSFLIDMFVKSFVIAVQIAAPIVATLFLVDLALGLISRTVPQMNVFVVGLPLKILVSFAVLFISLPGFIFVMNLLFSQMFQAMEGLTQMMVGLG
jgi:flagellar biosynthetic protein FliR